MEMPKVPVVSRYFIAYLASFVAVAPFFRAKVAPFFRAKDKPQTGTVKFFDKALCNLAGMKDTALSAYLHRTATAWYNEARSAQLFLLLSGIAWYIAGAGCYISPFISGVLYS